MYFSIKNELQIAGSGTTMEGKERRNGRVSPASGDLISDQLLEILMEWNLT